MEEFGLLSLKRSQNTRGIAVEHGGLVRIRAIDEKLDIGTLAIAQFLGETLGEDEHHVDIAVLEDIVDFLRVG
jgi:hypothetical protein